METKLREALKAGSPKRAAPNINSMWSSCGELKATGIRAIFLAARGGFFTANAWRRAVGEKRVRHDFAEQIPQICHRAVRSAGRGYQSIRTHVTSADSVGWAKPSGARMRVRSRAHHPLVTRGIMLGMGGGGKRAVPPFSISARWWARHRRAFARPLALPTLRAKPALIRSQRPNTLREPKSKSSLDFSVPVA